MQAVLLVFVIGVLNVALGYAVAVYLGLATPTLPETWRLLGSKRPIVKISGSRHNVSGKPVLEPGQERPAEPILDTSLPASAENAPETVVERPPMDVDAFRRFVAKSVSSLADFAARLKRYDRAEHLRSPWSAVAELQEICQPYLERLTQAAEQLSDQLGDTVQDLILEQAAQLETTLSNLQYMDFGSGDSAAEDRLSQESGNTLAMARRLQQALKAPS
jgi:hypothetical protein